MGRVVSTKPDLFYAASEGEKFSGDTTLQVVSCHTCGIPYAIPERLVRSAMKYLGDTPTGWKLCCPLGHVWWYVGETTEKRLRRQLQEERDRRAALDARLDQTRASLRATRAAATRARNEKARLIARVANGVCPCCHRTFQQLARHIAAKHPDFVDHVDETKVPV